MVRVHQLSFGYSRKTRLFEDLSLQLEQGQIYGLLGKNGAGKSSLLRNLAGLLYPQAGTIRVAGFDPARREPAFLQEIFFVAEEIYVPPVSIRQYAATLAPFYPRFSLEQFRHNLTELEVPAEAHLQALSYGQKKKVLIAFALATNTRVLLMDEPTNGLDIPSKSQFRRLVASSLEPDRLFLISTHQVRDLDNLIDSVIILDESEILLCQPLHVVSERLHFATLPDTEPQEQVLHAEPALRGQAVVMENLHQEESRVDLERLFNAAMSNPFRIRQLFK